jgi:hypothetical protein
VGERWHGFCSSPLHSPVWCCQMLASLLAAGAHADNRQPRGSLPGWGGALFLLDWPALEPQSTRRRHMEIRRRPLGRSFLHARTHARTRARCVVLTEHLGDRRKTSPVCWSTEAIFILGSTAGVPEERSAALPDLRWSSSLNRHKICQVVKMGMCCLKEACSGLKEGACLPKDALLQRMPGHVLRTRAASAPGRHSRRYGGEAQRSQPRCRSVGGSPAGHPRHGKHEPSFSGETPKNLRRSFFFGLGCCGCYVHRRAVYLLKLRSV